MIEKETPENKAAIGKGKPGPGRPKGIPNKTTTALKEAILLAAEQAGKGSVVEYLAVQAVVNPQSFLPLLGKVLPLQVTGEDGGAISVKVSFGGDALNRD